MEILKASSEAGTLIILDEPTAALNPDEVDELFDVIRKLKAQGIPVLYVSHRLDEIPRICDRVVVLRDGSYAGELDKEHSVPDEIIPLLVGRQITDLFPELPAVGDGAVLEVDRVSGKRARDVSFTVHAGEILGITGAIGAGQRNIARIIFGADTGRGTMTLNGKPLPHGRPDLATAAGIGYVSGDRKTDGLIPSLSVWRNATLVKSHRLGRLGVLNPRAEKKIGLDLIKQIRRPLGEPEPGDRHPERRQPAKGPAGTLGSGFTEAADPGRTHARRRRRRTARNLRPDRGADRNGHGRHHRLGGSGRTAGYEPPRPRL